MPPTLYADTPDTYPLYCVAEDANGYVDPLFNQTVTLAMDNNPDNATLDGTPQETASNGVIEETASDGVADFSSLAISEPGTGDTLTATDASDPSLTTVFLTIRFFPAEFRSMGINPTRFGTPTGLTRL